MRKSVPVLGIYVALALLTGVAAWGSHNGDSTPAPIDLAAQTELASARERLLAAEAELASTKQGLSATGVELAAAQDSLVAAQAEATSTRDVLLATQAELASSREVLFSTQTELTTARAALATAKTQVRTNPTYSEAVHFLKEDQTNRNKYDLESYNCKDFSADVLSNADARGLRAAYVSIRLAQGSHAVVAFETTDRGLVYFEPQTDREVLLPVGQSYLQANGYKPREGRDDTITRVTVIW